MTGEQIFFLGVVWALASVPLSLLLAGIFSAGAKTAPAGLATPENGRSEEAA